MYEHASEYGLIYRTKPPYEVLASKWVSYDEMLEIRLVEEMLELHYNSGQFLTYLAVLEQRYASAFQMFLDMGHFYRSHGYLDCSHNRVRRTEIVLEFADKRMFSFSLMPGPVPISAGSWIFQFYTGQKSKPLHKPPDVRHPHSLQIPVLFRSCEHMDWKKNTVIWRNLTGWMHGEL